MTESQYSNLIHQAISGQITADKQQELDAWLAADPAHQEIYEEMAMAWAMAEMEDLPPIKVNTEVAYQRFAKATAEQPAPVSETKIRPMWTQRIGQIAAAIALVLGAVWALQVFMASPAKSTQILAQTARTSVTLPDHSVVILNKGATLSYNNNFDQRHVKLSGEAFFDVTKNPEKPFTIQTKNTQTKVLGTSFNVKTGTTETEVTVFTGKVAFAALNKTDKPVILTPNEKGVYAISEKKLSKKVNQDLAQVYWQKQELSFEDYQLAALLPILENVYNIQFQLSSPNLRSCLLSGTFVRGELDNAIEALKVAGELEIENKGEVFVVDGEGCD